MLVQFAKVLAQFALLLDPEVLLIAEEDNTTRSDEPGEIVLLCIGQVGKVDARNFSADLGTVVADAARCTKQFLEIWVAEKAFVVVGNFSEGIPVEDWIPWTEVFVLVCVVVLLDGCSARDVAEGVGLRGPESRLEV